MDDLEEQDSLADAPEGEAAGAQRPPGPGEPFSDDPLCQLSGTRPVASSNSGVMKRPFVAAVEAVCRNSA